MKILIVKTSSLGDILQSFPLIPYLKELFPHAQIDWVVEKPFSGLVEAHPSIHRTLAVKTKSWRQAFWKKEQRQEILSLIKALRSETYDLVFDLQGNSKSAIITALAKSRQKIGFGKKTVAEWPNLLVTNIKYNPPQNQNIREDYLFLAQSHFKDFSTYSKPLILKTTEEERLAIDHMFKDPTLQTTLRVIVCPGSAWTNKQVTEATLSDFLLKIQKKWNASFIFVWGNADEMKFSEKLKEGFPGKALLALKMSLAALQAAMSQADLVIAMDSLPLHLAGTTGTPTYAVFGSSSAKKYNPNATQNRAFQGSCPFGETFNKRCKILRTCKTGSCIKDISSNSLFEDFDSWWS